VQMVTALIRSFIRQILRAIFAATHTLLMHLFQNNRSVFIRLHVVLVAFSTLKSSAYVSCHV
jgi:hypothetical protein